MSKRLGMRLLKTGKKKPRRRRNLTRTKTLGTLCGELIYTVFGVHDLLDISETTVYREIYKGRLEAGRAGNQFRILESKIYDWLHTKKEAKKIKAAKAAI